MTLRTFLKNTNKVSEDNAYIAKLLEQYSYILTPLK